MHRQQYVHDTTPANPQSIRPHTHQNGRCVVRNVVQVVRCTSPPTGAPCLGAAKRSTSWAFVCCRVCTTTPPSPPPSAATTRGGSHAAAARQQRPGFRLWVPWQRHSCCCCCCLGRLLCASYLWRCVTRPPSGGRRSSRSRWRRDLDAAGSAALRAGLPATRRHEQVLGRRVRLPLPVWLWA